MVAACLTLVAWERNEYTVYQLRVNNIRAGSNGGTVTITDPITFSGAVSLGAALIVTGDLTANSDFIMENDEMLRNDVNGDVEVIFDDDAATLGQLILDTSIAVGSQADNDLYEIIGRALDSAENVTDYATIQLKITDNTTTTEDGQILMQYIVGGAEVTGLTLGANASGVETCLIRPNLTITGDVDIDGNDLTSAGDLLITPAGAEVHIDGGLSVGDTTAVGDNNFKVVGTALFASTVEIDAGLDLDGDALTSNGDLLITPGGAEVHINGGLDVGGTSAVGDNNLNVVGTAAIGGAATLTGGFDANAASTCTNLALDAGATLTVGTATIVPTSATELTISETTVTVSGTTLAAPALTATSATVSGAIAANGTIAGDNDTVVTGLSNTTWVAGATLTVGTATIVPTSATELTITENTVSVSGALGVSGAATLTGGFDANAASTATNITLDSGATLDCGENVVTNVGAIYCDSIAADGTAVAINTGTGEVTLDGKYAAVGPDATTPLMIQTFTATIGAGGSVTQAFTVAFGAAPIVTFDYTESPGTSNTNWVGTVTASNVILNGLANKAVAGIAVGQRP